MTVRAMSKKELATSYGVSQTTFTLWLERAGIIPNNIPRETYIRIRIFTPAQVQIIFDKIGNP